MLEFWAEAEGDCHMHDNPEAVNIEIQGQKMSIAARECNHTFRHRPGRIAELRALWLKLAPVRNAVIKRAENGSVLTGKFNRTPIRIGVGVCKAGQS